MQCSTFYKEPVVVSLPVDMSVVSIFCRNVNALRQLSMSWLPLLCSSFIAAPTEQRGPLGDAIAAYASISSPDAVAGFFSTAMQKFIQVLFAALIPCLCPLVLAADQMMQQSDSTIFCVCLGT